MNKFSIKTKLLIYNFLAQIVILIILSFGLYKALEISSIENMQSQLKVIILDIAHDMSDYDENLTNIKLKEQEEYRVKPLYIKITDFQTKNTVIQTHSFPIEFNEEIDYINHLDDSVIYFQSIKDHIICTIKTKVHNKTFVVQLATSNYIITNNLENLLYSYIFLIPIIFVLLSIVGYFFIHNVFLQVQTIVTNLKTITAKDLTQRLKTSNNNDEIDLLSKEINNLLERLEISFAKISQFSSDASHELKTPLTIIRGELEVALRKDRNTDYYKQSLQTCLDEILNIQKTVDDLLFLAKSEYKNTYENDVYVDETTIEAVNELKNYSSLESIDIDVQIIDSFSVKGDAQLLKIAIKNLLKNAITYSHKNSSVTIKNQIINGYKTIVIIDRGIGIKEDDQNKIFEHFYRTDKSRDKHSGGTGLGMSIVKKIVDLHNGKITLKSKENNGTMITIQF